MSLLWGKKKQPKKYYKRPSPKHSAEETVLAQIWKPLIHLFPSIKGISPSIFLSHVRSLKMRASMTVEAAIVLPLFLFFFINMGCAIEMIRLHGNLELAMRETGNKMSVYGYALDQGGSDENGSSFLQEVSDIAFSYAYVRGQIVKYVGEDYLDQSPIVYGAEGLQFIESEIFTDDDSFEIVLTYTVSPWLQVPGVKAFRMANKYYGHIWNGYRIGETDDYVYMAKNGAVYHESRDCTHLSLTIREISAQQVPYERNGSGGRYTCCERCGKGTMPATVYIGVEGDRYHYDRDCSGLRRSVYTLPREEAQAKYRPCSRCG